MHDLDDRAADEAFCIFRCAESHAMECHAIDRLPIPGPYATKKRHWTYPVMGSRERTAPRLSWSLVANVAKTVTRPSSLWILQRIRCATCSK